jgi:hypothetical protein
MKTIYTIVLVTFISAKFFGQAGYKLDPGKLKIWDSSTAGFEGSFPGSQYIGIENITNLSHTNFYSYKRLIGVKSSVTSTGPSYGSTTGMYSSATTLANTSSSTTPIAIGVIGDATGSFSYGLQGNAYPTNASENGFYRGVHGNASAAGASATNYGISGSASGSGNNAKNYGVYGSSYGQGVSSSNYGVFGEAGNSFLSCSSCTNYGVYGTTYTTNNSFAGYFQGNVHVNGTLSKSSGTFKIDHPLDPLNKYLSHSFVESPDMMNIYNGNITTDQNGRATVSLPDYFEALNMDFRYQLTAIGEFTQVIVKEKISENQFVIATDKPNIEVSWQVTGVRNDAYAQKNRVVPEQDKPSSEKGKYLNADAFGLPREESLHTAKNKEPQKIYSLPTDENQEIKKK